jgi:hypothetical protein
MLISQVLLSNMRRFAFYSKHAKYPSHIDYHKPWLQGSHSSYSHYHKIMKLIILRLNIVNKPSPMSEGVAEIRINNQPCKDINLTTQHTLAQRAPRVATIHNEVKETIRAHLTLVHVFHAYASTDTPWVAHALSHYTSIRYGRIASVSTGHDATQFGDSICPVCVCTFKCLFIQTQPTRALTDTGGGYHLEALNIRSDHSPSFPSSILHFPLIAPPGLQLCQSFDHLAKPHRTSIDRKGPIVSRFQPLVFYR